MTTEANTIGILGVTTLFTSVLRVVHYAFSLVGPPANGYWCSGVTRELTNTATRLLAEISATGEQLSATADELRQLVEQVMTALVDIVPALASILRCI